MALTRRRAPVVTGDFLSLDYPARITYGTVRERVGDNEYSDAERAYFAGTVLNEHDMRTIRLAGTREELRRVWMRVPRVDDHYRRAEILRTVLRAKFSQHPELAARLLALDEAALRAREAAYPFVGRGLIEVHAELRDGRLKCRDGR